MTQQRLKRLLWAVLLCLLTITPKGIANSEHAPSVALSKELVTLDPEEGRYELNLRLTPSKGSLVSSQPLDVIFVADMSGSMEEHLDRSTRLAVLKEALTAKDGLITSLLSNSQNRLSIVRFAGKQDYSRDNRLLSGAKTYDDARTVLDWTNDESVATNAAKGLEIESKDGNTGTNLQAGLKTAEELLKNSRAGAKKVLVLLTDGIATMYYNNDGYTHWPSNTPSGDALDTINEKLCSQLGQLLKIGLDGCYSIQFASKSSSLPVLDEYLTQNFHIPHKMYQSNNKADLIADFKKIAEEIVPLDLRQVTISDTLSAYVDLAEDSQLRVEKVANGKTSILSENQVSLTKQITADGVKLEARFADGYYLEDGADYILKFTVVANQTAHDAYDKEEQKITLPSNNGAYASFIYGDLQEPITQNFPEKPEFTPAKLTVPVEVKWDLFDGSSIPDKSLHLKLLNDTDSQQNEPAYRSLTLDSKLGAGNFSQVAKGHAYDLSAPDVAGFEKIVVNKGTAQVPHFEVTYRELPNLSISKVLKVEDDKNEGNAANDAVFTMEVNAKHSGRHLAGNFGNVTFKDGLAEVNVKANETVVIPALPRGTTYTVREKDSSSQGYDVSYETDGNNLTSHQKVVVTNRKLPSLSVTKTVLGDYGDRSKDFEIKITLTDKKGNPYKGTCRLEKNGETKIINVTEGVVTLKLKHQEKVTLYHLPLEGQYHIEEVESSQKGYTVSYETQTGTLDKNKTAQVINTATEIAATASNIKPPKMLSLLIGGLALLVTVCLALKRRKQ